MSRPDGEIYTHSHHPVVLAAHARRTAEEAAGFLLAHLEPPMSILDLGCGPGSITVGLARYVAPGRVVGVDAAPAALEHARTDAAEQHMDTVEFVESDVYTLPFDDGTFDVVYAHQLLQHLADPVAALDEARRVLRSGGYIAVRDADYGTMTHHPHDDRLDRWLEMYSTLARANGGEPNAGRRLVGWVRAAGFEHLHPTTGTWVFATPDERRWWADLWAGRIDVPTLRSRALDLGLATVDDMAEIQAAFSEWADEPDGWFAFIQGEVLATKP
ncbi:MAG: methyltransferase domain-containing protein [Acidimicrobiia bacterium]|nr:methyltransferase domain-containing protein [Acidimicrobiia bacterium]